MPSTLVVFDIGGVLVEIRHTWDDVLSDLGEPALARSAPWRHADYAPLTAYQDDSMSEADYLTQVGQDLGLSTERAKDAHAAMLGHDYPGARALIEDLKAAGVQTACLSNTNALHWETLIDAVRFPAIAALDERFASFAIRVNKPLPGAFEAVAAAFPNAERRIFFDDMPANVEAANRFGWEAFRIDPEADPPAQMRAVLVRLGVLPA